MRVYGHAPGGARLPPDDRPMEVAGPVDAEDRADRPLENPQNAFPQLPQAQQLS
jgi:hypothetical protein